VMVRGCPRTLYFTAFVPLSTPNKGMNRSRASEFLMVPVTECYVRGPVIPDVSTTKERVTRIAATEEFAT
jgi:hypothetical protein